MLLYYRLNHQNNMHVSQDVIDREIEVGKELAIQEGKPLEMARY